MGAEFNMVTGEWLEHGIDAAAPGTFAIVAAELPGLSLQPVTTAQSGAGTCRLPPDLANVSPSAFVATFASPATVV